MRGANLRAGIILAALSISGCTMIPDYSAPAPPIAENWPESAAASTENDALASIAWTEFFQSEELRTVIQTALENNRDLRLAVLRIEEGRSLYRVERSDLVPNVNVEGSGAEQYYPEAASPFGGGGGGGARISTYSANVSVNAFELDLFGRLRSENRAALQVFLAAEDARDALQVSLIAETANAFLQWLADREMLFLSRETLEAQLKSMELINKRFDNGIASKLDVAQAKTAVESARASQALFARRVAQDKSALALLMGVPQTDSMSSPPALEKIKLMERPPVGAPSEVLLHRPDVKAAEHALKSQNARIGAARAAFFPSITLTGSYGFASSELTQLFSDAAMGAWTFVPRITMPIFQAGRNRANLDLARVRKNMAVAKYERTIQTAFREVADELAAQETLEAQWKAQRNLAAAAQDAYDLSFARYKSGVDSYLAVLDAQRALFNARQNEIDIQRRRLTNMINLYKALGGGANAQ